MTGRSVWTSLVVVWVLATLFGLAVAALTRIAPVLLMLTRGHGVHLGDVIGFAAAYTAAAMLTVRTLIVDRSPEASSQPEA